MQSIGEILNTTLQKWAAKITKENNSIREQIRAGAEFDAQAREYIGMATPPSPPPGLNIHGTQLGRGISHPGLLGGRTLRIYRDAQDFTSTLRIEADYKKTNTHSAPDRQRLITQIRIPEGAISPSGLVSQEWLRSITPEVESKEQEYIREKQREYAARTRRILQVWRYQVEHVGLPTPDKDFGFPDLEVYDFLPGVDTTAPSGPMKTMTFSFTTAATMDGTAAVYVQCEERSVSAFLTNHTYTEEWIEEAVPKMELNMHSAAGPNLVTNNLPWSQP